MEHGRIMGVRYWDESERGNYDQGITTVGIGDTVEGLPVREIQVEYPKDRAPMLTFVHGDAVTVLPDCRIVSYTAERPPTK